MKPILAFLRYVISDADRTVRVVALLAVVAPVAFVLAFALLLAALAWFMVKAVQ